MTAGCSVITRPAAGAIDLAKYGHLVIVQLCQQDIAAIRNLPGLARGATSTFLSVSDGAFLDLSNNAMIAVPASNALPIAVYSGVDFSPPALATSELQLGLQLLTFRFNETIRHDSVNASKVTVILSAGGVVIGSSPVAVLPNSTELPIIQDPCQCVVQFTIVDVVALVGGVERPTQDLEASLILAEGVVTDLHGNAAAAASNINVSSIDYTSEDAIIMNVSIDLNSGSMNVKFAQPLSLQRLVTNLILVNGVQLSDSIATAAGQLLPRRLSVQLGQEDLHRIKLSAVGTPHGLMGTTLAIAPGGVADVLASPNTAEVVGVIDSVAVDVTPPSLESASLQMSTGERLPVVLVLIMDEPVHIDASSINVGLVTLAVGPEGTSVTFAGATFASIGSSVLQTQISVVVPQAVEDVLREHAAMLQQPGSILLDMAQGALQDVSGVPNAQMTNFSVLAESLDLTPPRLVKFELDLASGEISLGFTEDALPPLAGIYSGMRLHSSSASGKKSSIDLMTDAALQLKPPHIPSTTLVFMLAEATLNHIKSIPGLAAGTNSASLDLGQGFVLDVAGNSLAAVVNFTTTSIIFDHTPPVLRGASLNSASQILTLAFDEIINASTLDPLKIVIQNMAEDNLRRRRRDFLQYRLTGGTVLSTVNSPTIALQLSRTDRAILGAIPGLATTPENTFIVLLPGVVADMSGNSILVSSPPQSAAIDGVEPVTNAPATPTTAAASDLVTGPYLSWQDLARKCRAHPRAPTRLDLPRHHFRPMQTRMVVITDITMTFAAHSSTLRDFPFFLIPFFLLHFFSSPPPPFSLFSPFGFAPGIMQ